MGMFTYPKRSEPLLATKELHSKQPANLINGVAILKMQTEHVSFDRVCRWSATTVLRTDTSLTAFQGSLQQQDLPFQLPGSLNSALFQLNSHFAVVSLKFVLLLLLQLRDLSFLSRCHKYVKISSSIFHRNTNIQSHNLSAISYLHCWKWSQAEEKHVSLPRGIPEELRVMDDMDFFFFEGIKPLWFHNHSLKSHLRQTEGQNYNIRQDICCFVLV